MFLERELLKILSSLLWREKESVCYTKLNKCELEKELWEANTVKVYYLCFSK